MTVTLLDGLVYARSLFDSSMNYRCAMVIGTATPVTGPDKLAAMRLLSEHLMPGRWAEVREPTKRELAATLVLRLPLAEASVKLRAAGAEGEPDDGESREVGRACCRCVRWPGSPSPTRTCRPAYPSRQASTVPGDDTSVPDRGPFGASGRLLAFQLRNSSFTTQRTRPRIPAAAGPLRGSA